MSSYSFYFLFDYFSFEAKITPVLNALINGSSRELEQVAVELVKDNPEIWDFVGYSRVPLYDDDEKGIEDVINAGVLPWLLLVIFNYCSEFARQDVDYRILRQAGIDEKTINMLTDPKSLGNLLEKVASKIVPTNYIDNKGLIKNFNINDCPMGWLDIDDIEKIRVILQTNMEQTKTSTSAQNNLLSMLDKAITSKRALILGRWFN